MKRPLCYVNGSDSGLDDERSTPTLPPSVDRIPLKVSNDLGPYIYDESRDWSQKQRVSSTERSPQNDQRTMILPILIINNTNVWGGG